MVANFDNRNKMILIERLLTEFNGMITGSAMDRILGKHPEDAVLVGKLSAMNEENSDLSSKTNITRIGADFFISKQSIANGRLLVKPQGHIYYRVFPSLEEQREHFMKEARDFFRGSKIESFDDLISLITAASQPFECELLQAYQKVEFDGFDCVFDFHSMFNCAKRYGYQEFSKNGEKAFTHWIDQLRDNIYSDSQSYAPLREKVKLEHLQDNHTWQQFLITNSKNDQKHYPNWDFEISCELRDTGETCKVSISLVNQTQSQKSKHKMQVDTLFYSGLELELCDADFVVMEMPFFEDDYKYDRTQMAIGVNCTVESIEGLPRKLRTTHLPIFTQKRLKTREDIVVTFEELITDPVIHLNRIATAMKQEIVRWEKLLKYKKDSQFLTAIGEEKFRNELVDFQCEIARFENGIRLISEYKLIRDAFILMNQTFSSSSKGYTSWRLFQIVFIVSLLADICSSEYGEQAMGHICRIDKMDLLYFPTGGGKTEAFLGATIFTLFFDRLRGKYAGVSSIIKYPLRLLSVQQVQRVSNILAVAETIRGEHLEMKEGEPFSLGYFVGANNTPNDINRKMAEQLTTMTPAELNEKYKIIDRCPYCQKENLQVEFIQMEWRLAHRCQTNGCPSGGELPFYMVDREIFRYLPSVVITTIDKFALIGAQTNFRNILGKVHHKCKVHGYSSRAQCTEKDICQEAEPLKRVSLYDAAPTLLIQDELHLLRESLGTYDSHYETLVQYLIEHSSPSKKKLKIIGATATISNYVAQTEQLYMKGAIRFPCESPDLKNHFYYWVDDAETHRKIIGYAPYGKAIINSVAYSLQYMRKIIWKYFHQPSLILDIPGIQLNNEQEALKLLEDYWIFLQYNNVKQDGNKVLGAMEDPINTELEREGIQSFNYRKMTGDDTFQDVRKILAEVESSNDVFGGFNLIAATSMISHGVDADRFNMMFFFGIPGNTAEYIQAYSRVGRKYPGLVVMIMRPTREKDQSYLKNFVKFHDYKDILVEPVPINRWANKAVERTFPGIVSALILTHYDYELLNKYPRGLFMMHQLQEAIVKGDIDREDLKSRVKQVYQCDEISIGALYKEWIDNSLDHFLLNVPLQDFNPRTKRDCGLPEGFERLGFYRPMNSLRDSDTNITIELK